MRLALDTAMERPEGEIFIIPARLEECETLESLRKWHWVDLFQESGYEMLMHALRARADTIGAILQLHKSRLANITTSSPLAKKVLAQEEKKAQPKIAPKQSISRITLVFLCVTFICMLVFSFWKPWNRKTEPTPTSTRTPLGIGYINLAVVTVWREPGNGVIGTLHLYEIVSIIDKEDSGETAWFKCTWERDSVTYEGWIPSQFVELGTPPQ